MAAAETSEMKPRSLGELLTAKEDNLPSSSRVQITNTLDIDDATNHRLVELLMSCINCKAIQELKKEHGKEFFETNTIDKKKKYIAEHNRRVFQVATTQMTGFLRKDSSTFWTFKEELNSAKLHGEVLKHLFTGLNLSDNNLAEIESLLTHVYTRLRHSTENPGPSFNHSLFVKYFEKVPGSELKEMKVRLVFIRAREKTQTKILNKKKTTKLVFEMDVSTDTWTMNSELALAKEDELKQYLNELTDTDLDTLRNSLPTQFTDPGI